jgi:hypothetical protein
VEWEIFMTAQVEAFLDELYASDLVSHRLVNQTILVLEQNGPTLGRPLVDTVKSSRLSNMKELRPPSAGASEVRVLFVFDPWRSAVLLVAGDKSGQWTVGTKLRSPTPKTHSRCIGSNDTRRWGHERGPALARLRSSRAGY